MTSHLPHALICDLDGTLALIDHRNPFDYTKIPDDKPNMAVKAVLEAFEAHCQIILLSGREEASLALTKAWLNTHHIPYHHLYLRSTGDVRKDTILKAEIYREKIAPHFTILFVLEDRDRVVEMWREIGLTCFQVAKNPE